MGKRAYLWTNTRMRNQRSGVECGERNNSGFPNHNISGYLSPSSLTWTNWQMWKSRSIDCLKLSTLNELCQLRHCSCVVARSSELGINWCYLSCYTRSSGTTIDLHGSILQYSIGSLDMLTNKTHLTKPGRLLLRLSTTALCGRVSFVQFYI